MRSLLPPLLVAALLAGCRTAPQPAPRPRSEVPPPLAPGQVSRFVPSRVKPLLIMLDLGSAGADPAALDALSQRLWSELFRTGRYLMVSRPNTQRLLAARGIVLDTGLGEPRPMRDVGRALTADYLVFGHVGQIGQTFSVDVQMLDVANDRVVGVGAATASDLESLLYQMPNVARSVCGIRAPAPRVVTVPREPTAPAPLDSPHAPESTDVAAAPRPSVSPRPSAPPRSSAPPQEPEETPRPSTPPREETATPAPPRPAEEPTPAQQEETAPPAGTTVAAPAPEPPSPPEPVAPEPPAREESPAPVTATAPSPPPPPAGPPASLVASRTEIVESPEPPPPPPPPAEEQVVATAPPRPPLESPAAPEEPSDLDARLAATRRRIAEEIEAVSTDLGGQRSDPQEAQRLKNQASEYPADSPERARRLEEALRLDPNNTEILALAARTHLVQGEFDKALEECRRALRLAPDDSVIYTLLGCIYQYRGDSLEAAAAQERALELDDTNYFAQYNLALALWELDRARARTAFQRFIDMAETIPDQRNFVDEARSYLERAN